METTTKPWYEESFGEDYLLVYKHRDSEGAAAEVGTMIGWLGLPKDSQILDLCCGTGRHALALANAGYRVTGVDLSEVLLREAFKADKKKQIRWIQSDMRSLPEDYTFKGQFDAVVNLFTSFGYFEQDEEQVQVLKQIHQALKANGKFIIDYINGAYLESHLVPFSSRSVDNHDILESRKFQGKMVTKVILLHKDGKPIRTYEERVKLYTLNEMVHLLHQADLVIDNIYGNYDESAYEPKLSPRMILVGHRKESAIVVDTKKEASL